MTNQPIREKERSEYYDKNTNLREGSRRKRDMVGLHALHAMLSGARTQEAFFNQSDVDSWLKTAIPAADPIRTPRKRAVYSGWVR